MRNDWRHDSKLCVGEAKWRYLGLIFRRTVQSFTFQLRGPTIWTRPCCKVGELTSSETLRLRVPLKIVPTRRKESVLLAKSRTLLIAWIHSWFINMYSRQWPVNYDSDSIMISFQMINSLSRTPFLYIYTIWKLG